MATAEELRRMREEQSIFSALYDFVNQQNAQLSAEGRRPVLGGLLSKEPVQGVDTIRYEGIGNMLAGLLAPAAKAFDAPMAAAQGNIPREDMVGEALGTAGMAMLGGGAVAKPSGSLGMNAFREGLPAARNEAEAMARQILEMRAAGRAGDVTDEMMAQADPQYMFSNTPLPMDEASRMARAAEMGFDVDVPLYHGTAKDFPAFDRSSRGGITNALSAKRATWMADNPDVAEGYATFAEGGPVQDLINQSYAAERRGEWDLANDLMSQAEALEAKGGSGGSILPVVAKSNRLKFDAEGEKYDASDYTLMDKVKEAQNSGYQGLQIDNFVDNADFTDYTDATHVGIFDPRNIRSRFARFDPEFSHLANLTAANASPIGGLLAQSGVSSEQAQRIENYLYKTGLLQ